MKLLIKQWWRRYLWQITGHPALFGAAFMLLNTLFWPVAFAACYQDYRFVQEHKVVVRQNQIVLAHPWTEHR